MNFVKLSEEQWMFGLLCGSAAIKFAALWSLHKRRPDDAELVGKVSGLYLHPIKSCARIPLREALITYSGLKPLNHDIIDRHFMIARPNGDFVTARQFPAVVLIQPSLSEDGHQLMLKAPGRDELTVDLNNRAGQVHTYRIWLDRLSGMDCGDGAAAWVSSYLGEDLRLIYASPNLQKRNLLQLASDPWYSFTRPQDKVAFQDFAPYLLASDSSLSDLKTRMETSQNVDMRNFRPNITVSGGQPWDEDEWRTIYIGDGVKLSNLKPCDRCVMTTIDPDNAVRSDKKEPITTLETFRVDTQVAKSPLFGINLFADLTGPIKVGDPVYIVRGKRAVPGL